MQTDNLKTTDTNHTGTPDSSTGNNHTDDKPSEKVFTEEEVKTLLEKKLRGQGKELTKLRDQLSAIEKEKQEREQKELEEQGKFKEINQKLSSELEELRTWKEAQVKLEQERLEKLTSQNEDRLKKLPEALRKLVHPALEPEAKAQQINEVEALLLQKEVKIHGGAGGWQKPTDSASALSQAAQTGLAWIKGGGKK